MDFIALLIIKDLKTKDHLTHLLETNFKEIKIIAKFFSKKNMDTIEQYSPDIIFCDIDIFNPDPFELIDKLSLEKSNIIFISSENNPALKVIKFSGQNYLPKPISLKKLSTIIQNLLSSSKPDKSSPANKHLLEGKISIPTNQGFLISNLVDIIYIASSGNYCTIVFKDSEKVIVTKLLGEFEQILPSEKFQRIHQSYILNIHYLKKVVTDDGLQAELFSGEKIPIARRRKKELFSILGINKTSK